MSGDGQGTLQTLTYVEAEALLQAVTFAAGEEGQEPQHSRRRPIGCGSILVISFSFHKSVNRGLFPHFFCLPFSKTQALLSKVSFTPDRRGRVVACIYIVSTSVTVWDANAERRCTYVILSLVHTSESTTQRWVIP